MFYRCYTKTKCQCGRTYGTRIDNMVVCLKCDTRFLSGVTKKQQVDFSRLAVINKSWVCCKCKHNIGYLMEDDDKIAVCITCCGLCYISTKIDKSLTSFILHTICG